jgi:Reverse transcriptase (RNA-dependent DNA polymerase)
METPPRLPLCPRSPIQKLKAPIVRHPPQMRAGPSRRPQTPPAAVPPLPQRSPQHPMYRRLRTPSPLRDIRELSPTLALRWSTHLRKASTHTGNVYGELQDPIDIEQDISHEAWWECYTSGASSPEDASPLQLPEDTPSEPPRAATPLEYADPKQGEQEETSPSGLTESSNGTNSSESVDRILFHWQGLNFLMKEGGVHYLNYLLAKADTPNSELSDVSKVREWSYKDLLRLPTSQQKEWMDACHQELDSLRKHNVYDLINPPPGRRIIQNHWAFDRKTDGRKWAYLVAKGFSQIEGIDYDDIFSPVVRYESVRLIVALAALQHWHMSSVDVKTAFLYGELDEELFMKQPEGFKKKGQEHKVFHLKWALYGLKQAALQWWRALDRSMEAIGFKHLKSDLGVFVLMHSGRPEIIVIVYVDDAVFLGWQKHLVNNYKECFMYTWECRELGETKEFLKVRINCLKGVIT